MSDLDAFKTTEPSETLFLVSDDAQAKKLLSVWPYLWKHAPSYPKGPPPEDMNERWLWLWSLVQPDFEAMAERSGLPKYAVKEKFEVLKAGRLVYPDGTVSQWATRMLRTEVANQYSTKRKKNDLA